MDKLKSAYEFIFSSYKRLAGLLIIGALLPKINVKLLA